MEQQLFVLHTEKQRMEIDNKLKTRGFHTQPGKTASAGSR